jgi:hypothetical protein
LAQLAWAAWNDGEEGLIPEPAWIWIPPPALGSGKFGTPFARMQSANLIPCATPPEPAALGDLLEDPHAAIATAPVMAASVIKGLWQLVTGLSCRGRSITRA